MICIKSLIFFGLNHHGLVYFGNQNDWIEIETKWNWLFHTTSKFKEVQEETTWDVNKKYIGKKKEKNLFYYFLKKSYQLKIKNAIFYSGN